MRLAAARALLRIHVEMGVSCAAVSMVVSSASVSLICTEFSRAVPVFGLPRGRFSFMSTYFSVKQKIVA